MIGYIEGTVIDTAKDHIIVDTGSVGYTLFVTPNTLAEVVTQKEVSLWVHTVVRDDALDLYGFKDKGGREFFELLIGVSGIGPKTALGVLSLAPTEKLSSAIIAEDIAYLTNVSGIGKKSAQKIVLELQDKVGELEKTTAASSEATQKETETMEALESMGYSRQEARDALSAIDDNIDDTSEQIRAALKELGSK